MSERIAVCPGSFDPVTLGHLDIMTRASKLFDRVIVLVSVNPQKHPSFSAEERVEMIKAVTGNLPNIEVDILPGLWLTMSERKRQLQLSRAFAR